jgi:curli production assembly/transport component CsgE
MARATISTVVLLLASSLCCAAEDNGPIDEGTLAEIGNGALEKSTGFLVDRTITSFGAEFLREFAQAWRSQMGSEGIDLAVIEKPSARWGSTIIVEYNSHPLARVFLQAGRSASIKPLAINTADYIVGRVTEKTLLAGLGNDPDLGKEELP